MIPQCKGKDFKNLPKTLKYPLDTEDWSYSTKYDGHYVQIHKIDTSVTFYTSNGKPFKLDNIANFLVANNTHDFVLECEYIADTDGKLGSRTSCSTATFRANYSKSIPTNSNHTFMVFNILVGATPVLPPQLKLVEWSSLCTLQCAISLASSMSADGWEGLMVKHTSHINYPGKRVNTVVKLKDRLTADLLCVGINPGEGEYSGGIGSLVLVDELGTEVSVSSGLSMQQRFEQPSTYVGKTIEIQYEQILDTYIQPVFLHVREDK